MDFRTLTSRHALAALGACFSLLLVASPASAGPDGSQPQLASAGPDVVDRYVANHRAQVAIPYLSHGIGVTVDENGYPVSEPAAPAPREQAGLAVDRGIDWEATGFTAGTVLAAMVFALMLTVALRGTRRPRSA
jgi:hypothetical protein